ncbi:MAG TPA: IS21-like element helper ATPase IstB [Armatimonadota bacterium]|jgi:DNA replication protein DnaC|nr:IS21-like element helper ATPase IstB [Armatimonadota bacterium]
MLSHPLLPKLKELRLGGMADSLEARAEETRTRQLSPVEFLALLLDDEIERRQQRRQAQREREAGFDPPKHLSQFDFSAIPTLDRSLVLEMSTCAFIAARENWLIHGPTGVGKSHLATAIGHEAIRRGYTVYARQTHRLLADLHAARADGGYARRLQKVSSVDLLILDDFGLRPVSAAGADDLYEIVQRRYERGSILLTSNRAPGEWADLFGDSLLASAALDRLTHHARITGIVGESYRQKQRRRE